ncbi:hypothetical protein [Escherichia coli]|nr:hypothetical protein [Escherichia coli]
MSEIQFDTISGGIRKPGVHFEFNTRLAVNTLPGICRKFPVVR